MTCYTPLRGAQTPNGKVWVHRYDPRLPTVEVPCGTCIHCRIDRARQWAIRCTHEAQTAGEGMFITLTYAPEHLPEGGTLIPKHVTAFIKNLRQRALRREGKDGIRYFLCGEYGDKLSRPHYHVCVFGHQFRDAYYWTRSPKGEPLFRSDELERCWTKGYANFGRLTTASAGYTARYTMKKINGPDQEEHYQGKEPEFLRSSNSPGIGRDWIDQYLYQVYPDDFIVMPDGKRATVPRYYDKRLEATDADLYLEVKDRRARNAQKKMQAMVQDLGVIGYHKRREDISYAKKLQLNRLVRAYESSDV